MQVEAITEEEREDRWEERREVESLNGGKAWVQPQGDMEESESLGNTRTHTRNS